jgi:hypothetical protein
MPRHRRLTLAGVAAALVLAFSINSASANKLSVGQTAFRAVWTSLEFLVPLQPTVKCPVTFEGSFHSSTIHKVGNALIGYVTRASVGTCASGGATVLPTAIPWHIVYGDFLGTLPDITEVELGVTGAAIRVQPEGGLGCLFTTPANRVNSYIRIVSEAGGLRMREFIFREATTIPCGGIEIMIRGAGRYYRLGTTNSDIVIALI